MRTINSVLLLVGTALVCNVHGAAKTLTRTGDIALFEERIDSKDDRSLGMVLGGKYMGAINLTTLQFLNVFFTQRDQDRLPFLCQNGSLVIPQGVNTIVSVKSGVYASIDIPPTVNFINKKAFDGCNVEKIFVWPETVKQLAKKGVDIHECVPSGTEIVIVNETGAQNEIQKNEVPEPPTPPTEPNAISKQDSFSEAIAKQKGRLRKTEGPQKAAQKEKSLQDQLNLQKGKLRKTETEKRDPKEFYVSPLHQQIHGFDPSQLRHVEKTDKTDKSEAPKHDVFESNPAETNPAVAETPKDPFLNNNNNASSLNNNNAPSSRPRSPFLNDINNFNSRNLKHVDQPETQPKMGKEVSHPHADFLAKRRNAMGEDEDLDENRSTDQILEEDDFDNWDD